MGARQVSILGPVEAPLARLKGRTRWHMWLRAKDRKVLRRFARELMRGGSMPPSVRLAVDVDPVSAL
jgi:primosomal protein N' (replication factor Y)